MESDRQSFLKRFSGAGSWGAAVNGQTLESEEPSEE